MWSTEWSWVEQVQCHHPWWRLWQDYKHWYAFWGPQDSGLAKARLQIAGDICHSRCPKGLQFFGGIPIFEIPGRPCKVDIVYERSHSEDIVAAVVNNALAIDLKCPAPGDILIFLTGKETDWGNWLCTGGANGADHAILYQDQENNRETLDTTHIFCLN